MKVLFKRPLQFMYIPGSLLGVVGGSGVLNGSKETGLKSKEDGLGVGFRDPNVCPLFLFRLQAYFNIRTCHS